MLFVKLQFITTKKVMFGKKSNIILLVSSACNFLWYVPQMYKNSVL